ncbi:phage tail terminator protein [Pseudothauera rhizosphaerae]|uniref:Uncharacterized protein n=1 Tax=Pseudothauera rhizosphaerae TaxID=2565932 RepID=A0A4V3WAW4_9RHOO|nr:hypothetical protein [Pseudothauera rhizosphaerae]THF60907.1 hypothetical protein E6O51_11800 [Pseudothauera rhizosphaerae]
MSNPTFLGLEPLIVARLEDTVRAALQVAVLSTADIAGATEASLPKPSVRVVYGGHRYVRVGNGGLPMVEQTWLAVPAVRNVRSMQSGAPGRAEISPLCDAVLDALEGWSPKHGYGRLESVTPSLGPATFEGCTFVPLAFLSRFSRSQSCA